MKTNELYARLELLNSQFESASSCPTGEADRAKVKADHPLAQLGQTVLHFLCGTKEPTIQEKRDRFGETYFTAYDPVDYSRHIFFSEQELRVWLDQRYYH